MYCVKCGSDVNPNRWALGFKTCLVCGDAVARAFKHCIVPLHKSNYVPVRDLEMLKGINSKGGFHR